jgi:hypothetical protein
VGQIGNATGESIDWGYYIAYQAAKVQPGHFIDAPVLGLTYKSPTQDGITTETGEFRYIPREQVEFSVGSLSLGSALGDQRVSPVDLFGVSELVDPKVINIARLLQSLDADGDAQNGAIQITEPVRGCLDSALGVLGLTAVDFSDDAEVEGVINATVACYASLNPVIPLNPVSAEDAAENLNHGQKQGNIVKKNVSKSPDMKSDMAKMEIMPVYVPAQKADGTTTEVVYYNEDGTVKETRAVAKPIVVAYQEEVEGTGVSDVFVSISRDDGDTWKRRNISRTADKSSFTLQTLDEYGNVISETPYPGDSAKPMLNVKDNKIFVAWTDKYCRGGRPGYAITVCPDTNGDGLPDPCEMCRETADGTICTPDYPGDDAYWKDDIFGVGGPQRSVTYDPVEWPGMGEVPYNCVWAARGVIDPGTGSVQWFKPERLTSGRRDAFQLFSGAGEDVGFAIVWQEDPKGLMPGEGDGPGDGWSGANTNNKTDIWYSYIKLSDFDKIDTNYVPTQDGDIVDTDTELAGRVKALVPMSLPVKISDNDMCSLENMVPDGGSGEHDFDGEGEGTHRYCGTPENIGTAESPGSNPLCIYTVEKTNPNGELHHVCVTADERLLDGNTGASRPNVFLQPYTKSDGTKSAWAIIGYEESKGVGIPPEEVEVCGDEEEESATYKPDVGKNIIYHSFDFTSPELVRGGGIVNLPETDASGNPVYLLADTDGDLVGDQLLLDWKGDKQLAYENARRVRFVTQPKSKAGTSKTVLVALYRQGAEGSGKPADIFMRRLVAPSSGNPYAFTGFVPGAQNLSSVEPTVLWLNPFDPEAPVKMLRWGWSPANLADSSAKNPYTDALAHRGTLNGDELIIGYSLTPNWGRNANDKYDLYIRRSFNGGQDWKTDPLATEPIQHNVYFRVPVIDYVNQTVTWDDELVTTEYGAGAAEPPRNVSNLRNNRTSVLEPRLVKTPGTITNSDGSPTGYPEDIQDTSVYQVAYGLEFNQNQAPNDAVWPKMPLDIQYSRTNDKGQHYETVIVTPGDGDGKQEEGRNPLAKDIPEQGAAQIKLTPDGSRMYGIWLEEGEKGSDIMFRRVDYR